MDLVLNYSDTNFLILPDSLSALLSLQSHNFSFTTNPHILEIKNKYVCFKRKNPNYNITFCWLPSHQGLIGNERADEVAKNATLNGTLIETEIIPFTDFYEMYKKITHEQTSSIVKELGLSKGKKYFSDFRYNKSCPWFKQTQLNRRQIVIINRCRSDHYNLAASLARIGIISEAKCNCDMSDQDLNHVLWQCPLYEKERQSFIKDLRKIKFYLPLNVESLIAQPHIAACKLMCKYLKNCNLDI